MQEPQSMCIEIQKATNSERKEKPHKDSNEGRTNNRQPNGRKHRRKRAMEHKHKYSHPQQKSATHQKTQNMKGREDNTDDRKRQGQHRGQAQLWTDTDKTKNGTILKKIFERVYTIKNFK